MNSTDFSPMLTLGARTLPFSARNLYKEFFHVQMYPADLLVL